MARRVNIHTNPLHKLIYILISLHTKQNEVFMSEKKLATYSLPAWLIVEMDIKARDEFRSKSQMVEEALVKHFGFKRG